MFEKNKTSLFTWAAKDGQPSKLKAKACLLQLNVKFSTLLLSQQLGRGSCILSPALRTQSSFSGILVDKQQSISDLSLIWEFCPSFGEDMP